MAKTYTLSATSVNGGTHSNWNTTDESWDNYSKYTDSSGTEIKQAGRGRSDRYMATNILFDAQTLSSLRSKTVTSIKLTLTITYGTIYTSSSYARQLIGYKLNDTASTTSNGTAWQRSDADSTAASTTVYAGQVLAATQTTISSATNVTFDLTGSKVPKYGYVIGPSRQNLSEYSYIAISAATLTVVTNETDYTLTLSYNANGGTGAPSSQSATVTTTGTPSHTFTVSATRPTRSNASAGSYGVTYDANGGSVSPSSASAARTTSYTFSKWNTKSGGDGSNYNPSASITISANTTLYAQWTSSTSTASVTLPTPTRTGYSFDGWYTAKTGGTRVGGGGSSYTPSKATTLYAHWTATVVAPTITTQPSSSTVYRGASASLSVSATTSAGTLSYQWQSSSNNSTWSNISGATSASYSAPTSSTGTAYYRCVVTSTKDGNTASTTSSSASVKVNATPAPTISTQPSNKTVKVGGTASLSVSASSASGSLSYQWQSSSDNSIWSNVSGAISSSYSAPTSTPGTTYYRCVVKNTLNGYTTSTNSSSASVVVSVASPTITKQPENSNVLIGQSGAYVSVTATGSSLTYQWQSSNNNSSWSNVSGATSASYSFPTGSELTIYYRCVVTNTVSGYTASTTSNSAKVVVSDLTTPSFTVNPTSAQYAIGATPTALKATATSNGTVTYQWQSSNNNSSWSNVSGATGSTYSPPTGTAGTKYYRCVATATGGSQTKTANSSSASIVIIQSSTPVFEYDLSTIDATYNAGDVAMALNGTATAVNGTVTYQWYKSTDGGTNWYPISGANSNTYTPTTTIGGAAYYRVVATNKFGTSSSSATSGAAKITVNNVILDYDAKWSQYINSIGKPFVKLARLDFLQPNGSVLFSLDNNPLNKRSGAFIQEGELSVNLQNGARRIASVKISNIDGEFDYNVNKLWFGQQVQLWEGMILPSGHDFYISQGVFYVKDPDEVFEPGMRETTLNLVDKWAYLDGTLFGNLDGTYEVPLNSNVFSVIQSILDLDRGNGYVVDASKPVFTNYYNGKTTTLPDGTTVPLTNTPYTYRCDSENGTYADIILEMNTVLAGWIGYDANGQLRLDPSQDDILDTTKPVQWQFSPNNSTFLGATYSVKNSEVYNDIIIVGESLSEYGQTAGRATNYDPKSDTNANIIGLKTKRYQQSGYYTQDICESLAVFKLKRESVLKKSVTIRCSQLFHIVENNLVTIERTDKKGNPIERHLITGFTRPIAQTGDMSLNCTSVQDFPIATITTVS